MAFVQITAAPATVENLSFVIDYDEVYGDAVQLKCATTKIEAITANKTIDMRSFCGPDDERTKVRVTGFQVTGKLSFGDGVSTNPLGFYQAVASKMDKLVSFAALLDHALAVSETNPETSGRLWFPVLPSFSAPEPEQTIELSFVMNTFHTIAVATAPASAVITHPLGPVTP